MSCFLKLCSVLSVWCEFCHWVSAYVTLCSIVWSCVAVQIPCPKNVVYVLHLVLLPFYDACHKTPMPVCKHSAYIILWWCVFYNANVCILWSCVSDVCGLCSVKHVLSSVFCAVIKFSYLHHVFCMRYKFVYLYVLWQYWSLYVLTLGHCLLLYDYYFPECCVMLLTTKYPNVTSALSSALFVFYCFIHTFIFILCSVMHTYKCMCVLSSTPSKYIFPL